MKLLKVKTARFAVVVEKCGQPEIHTLWLKPEKDKRFQVQVKNSGENQETQVQVSLTFQQSPEPIRRQQVIDLINPGETKTVVFSNIGTVPFAERTTVTIEVEPVPTESTTDNNTAEYPVIYTLG
jgi:uncharacterized membrane protein